MRRAIILAGGRGTRLRPYSISIPKPLMPIVDTPILEIMIWQLRRHGFERFTLAVNYQADILKAYFGDGSKWNVKITYSLETQALGTMGPLTLIEDLPESILVCNGDILTDLNFADFFQRHQHEKRLLTISAAMRMQNIDFGVLKSDENGVLYAFEEKPEIPYLVSMGILLHQPTSYRIDTSQLPVWLRPTRPEYACNEQNNTCRAAFWILARHRPARRLPTSNR